MIIKYEYSGKSFNLTPYNTAQEKEIMMLELLGCEDQINEALSILGVDSDIIESLSEKEKRAMLFKFRTISIGDTIPIKYKCRECKAPNETGLSIDGIVKTNNITNDKIVDAFDDVTEDNIQDFVNVDIDDLDLDEYEKIFKEVKESCTKFEFIRKSTCLKCGAKNNINVEDDVISYMSEDTIMSIYQTYNDLVFHGKYTKQDIDTLLPFERTILIGLLNKTREELSK